MPLLDKHIINQCLTLAMEHKMTFGETLMKLRVIGVERYDAALVGLKKTYYSVTGDAYWHALPLDNPPVIAADFSDSGVAGAVQVIKIRQIDYPKFLRRIMAAGTVGYSVFITGGRAIYFGRRGEYHVEKFPLMWLIT